jgi:hypothetical protein
MRYPMSSWLLMMAALFIGTTLVSACGSRISSVTGVHSAYVIGFWIGTCLCAWAPLVVPIRELRRRIAVLEAGPGSSTPRPPPAE